MSKKIDINQAVKYLSHEGPLAKENPDFEERTAQLELVKNISECFNENKIFLIIDKKKELAIN